MLFIIHAYCGIVFTMNYNVLIRSHSFPKFVRHHLKMDNFSILITEATAASAHNVDLLANWFGCWQISTLHVKEKCYTN